MSAQLIIEGTVITADFSTSAPVDPIARFDHEAAIRPAKDC